MLLTMKQVGALASLLVPVAGPAKRPNLAALNEVRARAAEKIVAASGISDLVILAADVVLQPGPANRRLWMGSWAPARITTELDGGPKDGRVMALPSLRSALEFRELAPSWAAAAAAGYPLPKVSYMYALAGYDSARGTYVHRYLEN